MDLNQLGGRCGSLGRGGLVNNRNPPLPRGSACQYTIFVPTKFGKFGGYPSSLWAQDRTSLKNVLDARAPRQCDANCRLQIRHVG